jgi:hypothetical protein
MTTLHKKNFAQPHETRKFKAHGHVDFVTLENFTLARGTFEPGWRWSNDVKPIAGTESCMTQHSGVIVSGSMTVQSDDGTRVTFGPGDVFLMEPGHDAWTEGDAPCIVFDNGNSAYAKSS